jgi:hypothetical protein
MFDNGVYHEVLVALLNHYPVEVHPLSFVPGYLTLITNFKMTGLLVPVDTVIYEIIHTV